MKKISCLIVGLLLILSVVGCGNNKEKDKAQYLKIADDTVAKYAQEYPYYSVTSGYDEESGKYIIAAYVNQEYITNYVEQEMDVSGDKKQLVISATLTHNDTNKEAIESLMASLKMGASIVSDELDIEIVAAYVNLDGESIYY